jgi:hypothetical protein
VSDVRPPRRRSLLAARRVAADVLGTPVCDPNMRRLHASWFVRNACAKISDEFEQHARENRHFGLMMPSERLE